MELLELLAPSKAAPDRPFLVSAEGESTYGMLRDQVDAYVAHLASRRRPSGYCVLQSSDPVLFAALYLACLETGWTFVPVPPTSSEAEIDVILRECPGMFVREPTEAEWAANPPVPSSSDAIPAAVIIYTSGSTGAPKGVVLSARALAANVKSVLAYLPVKEGDRHLTTMPFHYVYGLSMLNVHLARGAALVLSRGLRDPQGIVEEILANRCTGLSGVPTVYIALCKRSYFLSTDLGPQFRYMTQAGGRLSPDLVDKIRSVHAGAAFYVMYGCTEAAARITAMDPARYEDKRGSVGPAIDGITIEIRDRLGERLAPSIEGEIWITGDHLMNGYHLDASLTAEYLRSGWLKTGDLGYLDADGFLFLTGRSRDLIKAAGHRVAPREVEDVLLSHPEVEQVCVLGREIAGGDEEIVAVLVTARREPAEFRQYCLARLPPFKCPARFVFVDDLPKNSSGKVAKRDILRSLM